MNKTLLVVLAAVGAAAALVACGGDFCSRASSLDLSSKSGTCTNVTVSKNACSSDVNKCEAAVKPCSSADQTLLNNWITCMQNISPCQAGQEQQFSSAFLSCASPLSGLSSACTGSFLSADAGC